MTELRGFTDVDNAAFAEIDVAAAFFGMEIQDFIDAALQSGLKHACAHAKAGMAADRSSGENQDPAPTKPGGFNPAVVCDKSATDISLQL